MKKNIYIAIGVVGFVVVALLLVNKYNSNPATDVDTKSNIPQGKLVTGSDSETFSGTITAVDTGCFSDGVCSVSVDGKKVVLVKGGRGMSQDVKVGKLIGVDSIGDLEQKIGEHANVFATTTPEGDYSLYGNSLYYVEVVKITPKE